MNVSHGVSEYLRQYCHELTEVRSGYSPRRMRRTHLAQCEIQRTAISGIARQRVQQHDQLLNLELERSFVKCGSEPGVPHEQNAIEPPHDGRPLIVTLQRGR